MSKRIMIATGGTGGHVFPAMALAKQLVDKIPECQVLFVGGGLSGNQYFDRSTFSHRTIACGSFVNKHPWSIIQSLFQISKGVWQSRAIIREFKPDVAIGFGSFYSFPPLVAAKLQSVPFILHEANSIPGKVNRLLAKYAYATGVHFPKTVQLLNGRAVEVGMPLRSGYRNLSISKQQARSHFGLENDKITLLIFGGSQGARSLNQLIFQSLLKLSKTNQLQVLHIAGNPPAAEELNKAYAENGIAAVVKPFEARMDIAWQAADIMISRSGAGTIAEQLEFEVPGILIPYPYAADNHQELNADFMVETVGGGIKLLENTLNADILAGSVAKFLHNNGALLRLMRNAMCAYKKKCCKQDLCTLVSEVLI